MLDQNSRPRNLGDLKRLAKTLKKEMGIKHSAALELAARRGGFQHYHHARKALVHDREVSIEYVYNGCS